MCQTCSCVGSEANIAGSHDWAAVAGLPKLKPVFPPDLTQLWLPSPWSSVSQSGTAVHVQWQCGGDYVGGFYSQVESECQSVGNGRSTLKIQKEKKMFYLLLLFPYYHLPAVLGSTLFLQCRQTTVFIL